MSEEYTICSRCGQSIKNVIIINNKPYGTECASYVLGVKTLPLWFKGGDWNRAKAEHEANQTIQQKQFEERRQLTAEYWEEWIELSKAARKAYNEYGNNGKEFAFKFVSSIINQLGYPNSIGNTSFKSFEDAENNWKPYDGSFPYLYHKPKRIDSLSQKQLTILNKYL